MKTLIAEDDFTSRLLLQEFLKVYGPAHIAVNGKEAVAAARAAMEAAEPYDLICLDIMMPDMDGQQALKEIRALEEAKTGGTAHEAKVIMTTALSDAKNLFEAFRNMCDAYLAKPIQFAKLQGELRRLGLIP